MPDESFFAEIETWLAPCSPEPAGADARYDPTHESLRSRIAALDTPTGGEVDWDGILSDSVRVLGTSKDITIASFLVFALYQKRGLGGLAVGVRGLAELLDRYWDGAFPAVTRLRARANAIDWMTERAASRVAETTPGPNDHDAVDAVGAAAARLSEVVAARFEDAAPAMRPLIDAIKRVELSLPPRPAAAPPAAPEPSETPSPDAEAATPATPATPSPAASAGGDAGDAAPSPAASGGGDSGDAAPAEAKPDAAAPAAPLDEVRARVARLLAPISGDAPAGADARYEPIHEGVRNEVAKLDTPTGGEVAWDAVERDSESILTTRSKDILIAAHWAGARHVHGGLPGLVEGLVVLADLMSRYWEDAQPPKRREKARANAVDWLLGRLTDLSSTPLTASDAPTVAALDLAAKELARVILERFEERLPATRPLLEQIGRLELSLPKAAPPPKSPERSPEPPRPAASSPQAAPSPASASPVASAPAPAAVAVNTDDIDAFLRQTGAAMHQASRALYAASNADATSYWLARIGLYLHIKQAPPSPDGKKTAVPPPPEKLAQQLETLASNSNWPMVLEEAESALGQFRFWLDLHRYAALALGNLGHADAKARVISGVRALLDRMPTLVDLSFGDGRPFCSAITREWLASEVSSGPGGGASSAAASPEEAAIAEARQKAIGGARDEAITALEDLARRAPSGRLRFQATLAIAELLGGMPTVVDGLCTSLAAEVDRFDLDVWDPDLATRLYLAHLGALGAMAKDGNKAVLDRRAVVYARLCRVAPGAAITMK